MKRTIISLIVSLSITHTAMADSILRASEASPVSTTIVLVNAALVVGAVQLVVLSTSLSRANPGKVNVKVKNPTNGTEETLMVNQGAADIAQVKKGDSLTVKATNTGALIFKNDMALAYVISPSKGELMLSDEITR